MAGGALRRLLVALLLTALALLWAGYWGDRFFAARGEAEAAIDRLQPLLAAGLAAPELAAHADAALAESHRALIAALAGPILLIVAVAAAIWILARRRG